jgi:DNA-binding MarR family transcriptional regulator
VMVDLTDGGRDLVLKVMKARRRDIERILSNANPDQREVIRSGLEAFAHAAGEPEASLLLTLGL